MFLIVLGLLVAGVLFLTNFYKASIYKDYYLEYQKKHEIVLDKLRKEKRKIRVCFLVSENQKWNAQSIYDAMEKSEDFYPFVVVVTKKFDVVDMDAFRENVKFFRNCCKNVEVGINEQTNQSIDLKLFKPDIVFYQQPWGIFDNQTPFHILGSALPYYFPYSIGNVNKCLEGFAGFYLSLRRHFVFSEEEKQQCMNIYGCVDSATLVVGHPKLDVYNDYEEGNFQKKYTIYAPHFSFYKDSLLNYGTFDWSGKYVLAWAKSQPELNWVFKPHPQLKKTLLDTGVMTKDEVEQYYQDWEDLGKCYDYGNYFDLFKNSRCLITDCGSFLTEYFPTKNPVIHLRNPRGVDYSVNNKKIMQTYYDVWNIEQLRFQLDEILLKGKDPKREKRWLFTPL